MTLIMHSEVGKRRKRNAVLDTESLWPGGIIPYEIASYFNGESLPPLGTVAVKNKKSVNNIYLAPLILACTSSLFIYLSVEQQKRLILSAMSHWENNTCIRFRPKNSTDQYSIFIMSGPVHA